MVRPASRVSKVLMTGPLAAFADAYMLELRRRRYTPLTSVIQLRQVARLSNWLEVRGLGVRRVPHEPLAVVGLLVELGEAAAERLPEPARMQAELAGIRLPRLAVAVGADPLPLLLAELQTTGGSS